MNTELKSTKWPATMNAIKSCHLSGLAAESASASDWVNAFSLLVEAIEDERRLNPAFASELSQLTEESGSSYDFEDILEEYFDFLEEAEDWENVVRSCEAMVELFKWENKLPSQYMFRKGNAFLQAKSYDDAEAFGKEWLDTYPTDLYAAASNVFLMLELGMTEEAKALTEKYLRDDLVCGNATDTFYMAAYRLYELTDDINAKQRIEKKMTPLK